MGEISTELCEKMVSFYKMEPADDTKTNILNILYDFQNGKALIVSLGIFI